MWGQDVGCIGRDGLQELSELGLEGGCNGCEGLLELMCEGRTMDVMVVMVW